MALLISERTTRRHQVKVSRQLGDERETIEHTRVGANDPNRRNVGLLGAFIVRDFDRKPFETAMAGIDARPQRDPAPATLIERSR